MPDAPNRVEVENRVRVLRSVIESNQAKVGQEAENQPATAPKAEALQKNPHERNIESGQQPGAPEAASPASQEPAGALKPSEPERRDEGGGLLSKWWFWTAAGVVVAGVVAGVAIATSGGQERPKPLPSNTGVTVTTLRYAP